MVVAENPPKLSLLQEIRLRGLLYSCCDRLKLLMTLSSFTAIDCVVRYTRTALQQAVVVNHNIDYDEKIVE